MAVLEQQKLKKELHRLVKKEDWKELKRRVERLDLFQIIDVFKKVSERDRIILFRLLNKAQTRKVFKSFTHKEQQEIIDSLAENANKIAKLLNDIDPDDRTAFLEELPAEVSRDLIRKLSPEQREITNQLLGYPKESIGRLMTTQYVAIKPDFTAEKALEYIRATGDDSETLNMIYIVDDNGKLIDDIRLRKLIFADPKAIVKDLVNGKYASLNAWSDREEPVRIFKQLSMTALPVVDEEGILLGIVTFDDIINVAAEESSEDFHKLGGMKSSIENPLKARIFDLYKSRIFWLMALVFMNVFSGAALSSFENVIEAYVGLVFFLPLLIDSGGNAGSQTATLMVRSLAMGDVKIKDWYKLISKELLVSLLLGVTMAAGVSVVATFRAKEVVFVVASTMMLTVLVGSIVGLILPFIFTKLKLDPATASAPLITTIADISGVIIYFSIASWYLGM